MIAWIVGNGRSLEMTPPEKIKKPYVSFATNLIAKRFTRTLWRPTFFVAVSDGPHHPEYLPLFIQGCEGAKMGAFISEANKHVLESEMSLHTVIKTYADKPGWLTYDDGAEKYNRWGMSHMVSFQIAANMMPKAVYMIGFDGNFRDPVDDHDPNHFDPGYWGKLHKERPKDPEFYNRMNKDHGIAHSVIKVEYEKLGIPLYNCTPDSAFTMHEYVPFEEATRA